MGCIENSFQKKCWAMFTQQFFISKNMANFVKKFNVGGVANPKIFDVCVCVLCTDVWTFEKSTKNQEDLTYGCKKDSWGVKIWRTWN